jgi:hypothetical protein
MRSAQVYLRQGKYYINPEVGSQGGDPCLFSGPVTTLPSNSPPEVIGEAILTALQASHKHAPWPTDWKALSLPLFQAAGVKSWATFFKGTLCVRVDSKDGAIEIIPTTTKKDKNAFTGIDGQANIRAASDSPIDLGQALVEAIRHCE